MNLAALVAHHARYRGAKTAIEARDFTATYAEFDVLARRIAARLGAAGVGVGDLVGVRMRDTPLHLATLIGVFHLGAVVLPLDWRAAGAEVERIVARFPPKAVVADVTRGLPDGLNLVGVDAIADTSPRDAPAVALTDHPAVYSLTSGTTGEPKAIVLTHEQFFGRATTLLLERVTLPDDRFLALLPLAYSNGRVVLFSLLSIGATVMMFPTLFEPRELLEFVAARDVGALMVSPNVVRQLLAIDAGGGRLMPGLRVFVSGGAKLQPEERAAI
jgi:acyl-CoA synthetase (AMP-forming)/AMP-acid ligase II